MKVERFEDVLISIHTFLAEGDSTTLSITMTVVISIHTFLAEGDADSSGICYFWQDFNPHLPRGR